jgi:hypothetical protein
MDESHQRPDQRHADYRHKIYATSNLKESDMSILPKPFLNWFHHLTDEGKTAIIDDLRAAMDFLSPLAHDIVSVGGPLAIKAALDAVAVAQANGGSNDDKFNSAAKALRTS